MALVITHSHPVIGFNFKQEAINTLNTPVVATPRPAPIKPRPIPPKPNPNPHGRHPESDPGHGYEFDELDEVSSDGPHEASAGSNSNSN